MEEVGLGKAEGDGAERPDAVAELAAGVAVDAGGDVDGEDGDSGAADAHDGGVDGAMEGAFGAEPEDGVYDEVIFSQAFESGGPAGIVAEDGVEALGAGLKHLLSAFLSEFRLGGGHEAIGGIAMFQGDAGGDEAVSAIIAVAADKHDSSAFGEHFAEGFEDSETGPLHEYHGGHAVLFSGPAVCVPGMLGVGDPHCFLLPRSTGWSLSGYYGRGAGIVSDGLTVGFGAVIRRFVRSR